VQEAEEESRRYKKREMDLAWREHMSRKRIQELEIQAKERIDVEKKRVSETRLGPGPVFCSQLS